jgi:hypothetical protein
VFGAAVSCQTKKAGAFLGAGCKLGGNTVRLKGAPPAPSSGEAHLPRPGQAGAAITRLSARGVGSICQHEI